LILSDLGESLFRSSKSDDAIRIWKQAIDLWNSLKDFDRVAYYYARCGRAAWYINNYPLGLEICRQGMAAVPSDLDTPGMATLLHETARACYFNNHYDEAKFLAQQALDLAEQLELVNVQADTYATLGILPNQPPADCQRYLEKAVELAESAKFYDIASRAHQNLGSHMERYVNRNEGLKQFERALELSRRIRLAAMEQLNLISIIGSAMQMGNFKKAEEGIQLCREVIDNLPPTPNLDVLIEFMECQLDMFRGRIERAVRRGRDLYQEAKKFNLLDYAIMSANVAAMGLYMSNRAEEAYALMVDVLADPKMQDVHSRWDAYITRSVAAATIGRLPEAKVYSGLALKMMKGGESPLEMTFYDLTRAVIAREEENWEEAETLFKGCVESLVKLDLPLHRLMVCADQVKLYVRRHAGTDLEKARQLLKEMLLKNEELGIEYHPDAIREQLKKLES